MNTAFNYARDLLSFDCYIFHDVDVIAEDDRILYTCRGRFDVVVLKRVISFMQFLCLHFWRNSDSAS